MPFKSEKQMKYMYAKHPEIAKKWMKKYGMPKSLPNKKSQKKFKGLSRKNYSK